MNKAPINHDTITVQNKTSDCAKLSVFLAGYLKENNIPAKIYNDLRLVIEETFVNIAKYAFSDKEKHSVSIAISNTDKTVSITFTDSGIAFNPLTDGPTGAEKNTEEIDFCEGGMGTHIIKALTDNQEYSRIDQHNVFTVTKHYNQKNNSK